MDPRDVATVPDAAGDDEPELPSRLGHFEIVRRLGAGGMGLVFEGRDATLDRRVALKLLHPDRDGTPIAPARLLREAQALAKLSHPNVVTVFEVGMAGADPFVAMELVEGATLAAWMTEPRAWRTVLDLFIAVGHGLAAVHALGLVHRDFKPSNVLIDRRGTPKLGDFGLVRPVDDSIDGSGPLGDPGTTTLTQTGSVMGTPAYMAPEQRLGQRVDARADQYSFAKTLKEALGEPVPARLQPILARAMAELPDQRYPAMTALLDELARVRRGPRARWIALGASLAVVGATGIAWAAGRARAGDEPCPRPTDRMTKVWSPARRSALDQHLRSIDPAVGSLRFAAASGVFDRGSARWMELHVDACRSARAGRQSDALLDRRMSCLDRALVELDETAGVLERAADRFSLDDAMKAVGLPTLDDCADVTALTELLPRPINPVRRAEADAIARESVELDVALRVAGTKPAGVADRVSGAVARARALGDPETLARALRGQAELQLQNEAGDDTLVSYREAITAAAAAHDDRLVAELWTRLLGAMVAQKQAAEARTLLPAAEAALARTTSTLELRVGFMHAKAQVLASTDDGPAAQALLTEALALLEAAGASAPDSPLRALALTIKTRAAVSHSITGDWKATVNGLREVIPLANALYGPDHPTVMQLHFNLHVGLRRLGDYEGALVEIREAARIGEARLAPSPNLASIVNSVGSTLLLLRRPTEAIPYVERALAMSRTTLPPRDVRLAIPTNDLASVYVDAEQFEQAKPLLDEAIELYEASDQGDDEKRATSYFNRANWGVQAHRCAEVWPDFDRAAALYRKTAVAHEANDALFAKGECQLDVNDWAGAARTTEALMIASDASPRLRALARFDHGKALWSLGRKAPGIADVRAARAALVTLGEPTSLLELIDRWLARHAR